MFISAWWQGPKFPVRCLALAGVSTMVLLRIVRSFTTFGFKIRSNEHERVIREF